MLLPPKVSKCGWFRTSTQSTTGEIVNFLKESPEQSELAILSVAHLNIDSNPCSNCPSSSNWLPLASGNHPPPHLSFPSPKTHCMPYFHCPQIVMDFPCQHVIWSLRTYSTDWTMAQEELLRNKIIKILLAESINFLIKNHL